MPQTRNRLSKPSLTLISLLFAAIPAIGSDDQPLSSGRWVIYTDKPAASWEHGMLTGNGSHGARIMGNPHTERIICSHEELFTRFWDRKIVMTADIANLLPRVRELIDAGKEGEAYKLADDEAKRQLTEKGRVYRKAIIPHPAFDLFITYGTEGDVSGYRHKLDFETGEAMASWVVGGKSVQQRVFSSRVDNVNVINIKAGEGSKLNLSVSIREVAGRKGILGTAVKRPVIRAEQGWLTYDTDYLLDPGGYEGLVRVTTRGGKTSVGDGSIDISGCDEVLLLVRVTPLVDGSVSRFDESKKLLEGMSASYDDLFAPHAREHGGMFRRVTLDMNAGGQWKKTSTEEMISSSQQLGVTPLFLEQTYAAGRYLLISSCGKYPAPLQGIWPGKWQAPWDGGFVLDSNVNLAISAAAMGNLPECCNSYLGYIKGLLPGWRANAKSYLGCRGFLAGNYTDPESGYLVHIGHTMGWMYWPGGAGWNLHPIYDYGLFSGDSDFMKREVLPLYVELADFYEDYITSGKDGFYHIYPGVSPENRPKGQVKTLKDCTFDIAVAKEVFRVLVELGEQFNVDEKKIALWREYGEKLVPYRINRDGALAEWIPNKYGEFYTHRHISHLIQVYPWWEFSLPGTSPDIIAAAGVALNKRFAFDAPETHGLMHVALMAARLKDIGKVTKNLHRLASRKYFYNNLSTSCRDHQKIFNLDCSLSLPRLIMEMLVFSRPGHIELLPAWPADYPDGKITGVLVRGGHKLDISWKDGKLLKAALHTGCDGVCTVKYGKIERNVRFKGKESLDLEALLAAD